jgi:hypothetical protein
LQHSFYLLLSHQEPNIEFISRVDFSRYTV